MLKVVALFRVVDPELQLQARTRAALVNPVEILGGLGTLDNVSGNRLIPANPVAQILRNLLNRPQKGGANRHVDTLEARLGDEPHREEACTEDAAALSCH